MKESLLRRGQAKCQVRTRARDQFNGITIDRHGRGERGRVSSQATVKTMATEPLAHKVRQTVAGRSPELSLQGLWARESRPTNSTRGGRQHQEETDGETPPSSGGVPGGDAGAATTPTQGTDRGVGSRRAPPARQLLCREERGPGTARPLHWRR